MLDNAIITEHKPGNTLNESPIYWVGQSCIHRQVAFQSLKQPDHTSKYLAIVTYRQHYTFSSSRPVLPWTKLCAVEHTGDSKC